MNPNLLSVEWRAPLALLLAFLCVAPAGLAQETEGVAGDDSSARDLTQEARRRDLVRSELAAEGERRYLYARELYSGQYLGRARELYETFLILYPEHPRSLQAQIDLGDIYKRLNQHEDAIRALTAAYREGKGDLRAGRAYLEAGRILAGLGRLDEAREIFQEIKRNHFDSELSELADLENRGLRWYSAPEQVAANESEDALMEIADLTEEDQAQDAGVDMDADDAEASSDQEMAQDADDIRETVAESVGQGIELD